MRSRNSVGALLLLVAACGGGAVASVPPKLDLPIPPADSAAAADNTPRPAPPRPSPPEAPLPEVPHAKLDVTPAIQAIVDSKDRSEEDRKLDAGRHPAQFLAFVRAMPGMTVAEIGVGGGYTTELLARAVGPKGKVYAENSARLLKFAEKPWSERLKKKDMKNVVRLDREMDDPFGPDVKNVDVVVINMLYHDTFNWKVDTDKMNKAVLAVLKPGGAYVVIDHASRGGRGKSETETLHRIDERVVREDLDRAGFKLLEDTDAFRNKGDARDWSASPMAAGEKRGTSDRFALRFIKP
jgi:predicted methyltransferase